MFVSPTPSHPPRSTRGGFLFMAANNSIHAQASTCAANCSDHSAAPFAMSELTRIKATLDELFDKTGKAFN
jgi:hypothetical protein